MAHSTLPAAESNSTPILTTLPSSRRRRSGHIRKGDPYYYDDTEKSSMGELSEWIRNSDQVLTF
jgi:hypothetical protein